MSGRTSYLVRYAIGEAASGRWWWSCTRPGCCEYRSGMSREYAEQAAVRHQIDHERGTAPTQPTGRKQS